jgi:glycosyltransferase involved in cell wall biosynthesis
MIQGVAEMRVVSTVENRFVRLPDGSVFTPLHYPYGFWERHLSIFDDVRVLARIQDVAAVPAGHLRADGPGVYFAGLPHYEGASDFLENLPKAAPLVRETLGTTDAVILRVPSVASMLADAFLRPGRPFGVEVLADPWAALAPGSISHPLRPALRALFTWRQRSECARASVASYVTERALQAAYPCPGPSVSVSDVELSAEAFSSHVRGSRNGPLTVITVATLAHPYKGVDTLIEAVSHCVSRGMDLRLVIVGDGRCRPALEALVRARGLARRVEFTGQVLPAVVRERLDSSDLFVLASRTEGLPRALLEAMARGLPCLAAAVGGIPELLGSDSLVPAGSPDVLGARIHDVLSQAAILARIAEACRRRAESFRADLLEPRRLLFLKILRERTDAWRERMI